MKIATKVISTVVLSLAAYAGFSVFLLLKEHKRQKAIDKLQEEFRITTESAKWQTLDFEEKMDYIFDTMQLLQDI